MRCPACQSPVFENDPACRQCGFTLEAADRAYGVPPALHKPVTDPRRVLSGLARRRVMRKVTQIEHLYPQVEVAVLLLDVPRQTPMSAYAFWLFNRGQLSSAVEKGGENRLIMLLIDVESDKAAAMTGYGLEPFLQERQLQMCVTRFSQLAARGGLAEAIEGFLRELDVQLRSVIVQLPRQFGLQPEGTWQLLSDPASGTSAAAGLNY